MSFLAPIWLTLLLPWATLTVYLLTGQRERVAVPFLPLWDNTLAAPKAKRSFSAPPIAIVLLLASMLMAIAGAASPQILVTNRAAATVIVDRGVTMSAGVRGSQEVTHAKELLIAHGYAELLYTFVPGKGSEEITQVDLAKIPNPSAENSRRALTDAIQKALHEDERDPIVVVSDQPNLIDHPRVVRLSPTDEISNVGIVSLGARAIPRPQVMVRVRNQSDLKNATIVVRSGSAAQTQQIQLPPREGEQNYFLDLAKLEEVIEVKIDAKDDLPIDNVAWLVRQQAWPKIEPVDPLPAEVQRMVEVYQKNRPASANAKTVVVATDIAHLPGGRPGIVIASGASAPVDANAVSIVPHELTRDVDWRALAASATNASLPASDWTPLVRAGDRVLLAVRENPRQAFIAVDPRSSASSAQFVVLWGKLFDWAGEGGDLYATDGVHSIEEDTWKLVATDESATRYDPPLPGVYRRSDGTLLAMSVLDVKFPAVQPTNPAKLDALAHERALSASLRPAMLLGALLAALVSLTLFKPRKTTFRREPLPDV